jgi:UDP-glucuronate 4-epimerase
MNVILSNYFTTKLDPQRNITWETDKYSIIKEWVESLNKLRLKGILFHDNLSDEFIAKYSNKYLQFISYKIKTNYSLNDERFICFYEFLKNNLQIDKVFTTDVSDVKFYRNPFELINDKYKIYACSQPGKIKDNIAQRGKMKRLYGKIYYPDKIIANAGVIGGRRQHIITLFRCMINELKIKDRDNNWNMPVFNKCLYDLFNEDELLIGYPVTSKFKRRQKKGNFYIKHK